MLRQRPFTFRHPNALSHPMEDFCLVGPTGRAFAVADGVTQDRYTPTDFPNRSGAARAARLFCETVVACTGRNLRCDSDSVLRPAFDEANRSIWQLNEAAGIAQPLNFLEHDYFGAVGVAAFLCDDEVGHLHYGYVGDCRLVVLGTHGATKLETPDQVAAVGGYVQVQRFPSVLEQRRVVRSTLRNKPPLTYAQGRVAGYGVFTGEAGVRQYYRFGQCRLQEGDHVFLVTDGFFPMLADPACTRLFESFVSEGDRVALRRRLARLCDRLAAAAARFADDKAVVYFRV